MATFISPSGSTGLAINYAQWAQAAWMFCPDSSLYFGPATAETARALGVRVDLVAKKHTIDGLIETLLEWYQGRR